MMSNSDKKRVLIEIPAETRWHMRDGCRGLLFVVVGCGWLWWGVVGCGWLWWVVVGYGELWLVVVGCGELWLVMVSCGWLWLVVVSCGGMKVVRFVLVAFLPHLHKKLNSFFLFSTFKRCLQIDCICKFSQSANLFSPTFFPSFHMWMFSTCECFPLVTSLLFVIGNFMISVLKFFQKIFQCLGQIFIFRVLFAFLNKNN